MGSYDTHQPQMPSSMESISGQNAEMQLVLARDAIPKKEQLASHGNSPDFFDIASLGQNAEGATKFARAGIDAYSHWQNTMQSTDQRDAEIQANKWGAHLKPVAETAVPIVRSVVEIGPLVWAEKKKSAK